MYEYWYDYVKPKIRWKCKTLLYGYRQLHCLYKKYDICKYIAEDVETRPGTSNFERHRPLPKDKNKKSN